MTSPSKDWMTYNSMFFGQRQIRELVFPSSHDAGTYKRSHGTTFGTADNVITQNNNVLRQLCFGVRELDIRPALTLYDPSNWYCGHYTDTGSPLGWQGASCASLQEVVKDINTFTSGGHNELIIVRVSHIYKLDVEHDGQQNAKTMHISDEEWMRLFNTLEQIQYKYGVQQAGTSTKPLHEFTLGQFITGSPAVLVLLDGAPQYHAHLLAHGMWPSHLGETEPRQERLRLEQISGLVSVSQDITDAVFSTAYGALMSVPGLDQLGLQNYRSVLNLANGRQNQQFPKVLELAMVGWPNDYSKPSKIEMDRIENSDLLTFCLALSLKRNNIIAWRNDAVLVYGGQRIDPQGFGHVHKAFNEHKDNYRNYLVNIPNLGTDPSPGEIKSCAVIYEFASKPKMYNGTWARDGTELKLSRN